MAELTKEWLQNTITSIESARYEIPFGLDEDQSNMFTAFKFALASLEAEPVAKIIAHYPLGVDVGKQKFVQAIGELPDFGGYLFAAPPALVVPDKLPREYIRGWPLAHSDYAEGWNDCREAMLQSGNFRENKDSSTNGFREIAETSTNSSVIPGEVLSAILKVAWIRADFDTSDGDRRGIGYCLDEAEQELIVTINKYAIQIAAELSNEKGDHSNTGHPQAPWKQVNELTMLVKRLASSLKSVNKSSNLPDKAMEYLKHNGLVGAEDILR